MPYKIRGHICANVLERPTFTGEPTTIEQFYELSNDKVDLIRSYKHKINKLPIVYEHYENKDHKPLGFMTGDIFNRGKDWIAEVELDEETAHHAIALHKNGLFHEFSLAHNRITGEPMHLAIVWKGARPGAKIDLSSVQQQQSQTQTHTQTQTTMKDKQQSYKHDNPIQHVSPSYEYTANTIVNATSTSRNMSIQQQQPNNGLNDTLNGITNVIPQNYGGQQQGFPTIQQQLVQQGVTPVPAQQQQPPIDTQAQFQQQQGQQAVDPNAMQQQQTEQAQLDPQEVYKNALTKMELNHTNILTKDERQSILDNAIAQAQALAKTEQEKAQLQEQVELLKSRNAQSSDNFQEVLIPFLKKFLGADRINKNFEDDLSTKAKQCKSNEELMNLVKPSLEQAMVAASSPAINYQPSASFYQAQQQQQQMVQQPIIDQETARRLAILNTYVSRPSPQYNQQYSQQQYAQQQVASHMPVVVDASAGRMPQYQQHGVKRSEPSQSSSSVLRTNAGWNMNHVIQPGSEEVQRRQEEIWRRQPKDVGTTISMRQLNPDHADRLSDIKRSRTDSSSSSTNGQDYSRVANFKLLKQSSSS